MYKDQVKADKHVSDVLTIPPKTGSLNEHINMFVKGIKNEATTTRSIYDRV
jgi:hypothetical protein